MATPTEPATDALYQALSSREPDPQVVHAAIEEIRYLSGHSVIAAISAPAHRIQGRNGHPSDSSGNRN